VIAETRTMKALRNVVLTLSCTLTLIGATSMTNSTVAQSQSQAQAFSSTTTGVIVILAAKAGVTRCNLRLNDRGVRAAPTHA
jgi:hypothetical protein